MNSKLWTRSSNYREVYFKHNKGIFKKWYLCAYCKNRFLEKDIVEVDHCIAVNAVKKKWYFQLFFTAINGNVNSTINLVAACRKCNRKKSDKAGKWVIQGAYGKLIHVILQESSIWLMNSFSKYWFIYYVIITLFIVKLTTYF